MNEKEFRIELITKYLNLRNTLAIEYNKAIEENNKLKEKEYWALITELNELIKEQSTRFINHENSPISEQEILNVQNLQLRNYRWNVNKM